MKRLGAGVDNVAYLIDDLVVRVRRSDPGAVSPEARVLRAVGTVSPIAVPVPGLGLILRDLGPVAFAAAMAQVAPDLRDPGIAGRALFYARCGLIADLAPGAAGGSCSAYARWA